MRESLRHITAAREAFRGKQIFPVGRSDAAQPHPSRLLAQHRLIALDFPAVRSGFQEIERIRAVRIFRLPNLPDAVDSALRFQIVARRVHFLHRRHPNAKMIMHLFDRRLTSLMYDQPPFAVRVF